MTDPISGSYRTGMGVSGTIPPSFCKIQTSSIHTVKSPKIRLPTPRLPLAHPLTMANKILHGKIDDFRRAISAEVASS